MKQKKPVANTSGFFACGTLLNSPQAEVHIRLTVVVLMQSALPGVIPAQAGIHSTLGMTDAPAGTKRFEHIAGAIKSNPAHSIARGVPRFRPPLHPFFLSHNENYVNFKKTKVEQCRGIAYVASLLL